MQRSSQLSYKPMVYSGTLGRIRTCIKGLGRPGSIQLNYEGRWDQLPGVAGSGFAGNYEGRSKCST